MNFAQARANRVLSVPVTALLATAGGGYAVQSAAGRQQLIPVTTGLFAAGYRADLRAGDLPGSAGDGLAGMTVASSLDAVTKEYPGGVVALRDVSDRGGGGRATGSGGAVRLGQDDAVDGDGHARATDTRRRARHGPRRRARVRRRAGRAAGSRARVRVSGVPPAGVDQRGRQRRARACCTRVSRSGSDARLRVWRLSALVSGTG